MLSPHTFIITARTDSHRFTHGPVYDHTPEAALALVRLTFSNPHLWDVSLFAASNEAEKMHMPLKQEGSVCQKERFGNSPITQAELF